MRTNALAWAPVLAIATACAGPIGPRGGDGVDGVDGSAGTDGVDGTDGTRGIDGEDGLPGANGADGIDGSDGEDGIDAVVRPVRLVDSEIGGWLPGNVDRLNALLEEHGSSSPTYDPSSPPVVVFDWDNTVVKNDIGDATMFYALRNDGFLQPADWAQTNTNLTATAVTALETACASLAPPGTPLPTSTNAVCAEAMLDVYLNGVIAGEDAWSNEVTLTTNQGFQWLAQLFAGLRPEEVRSLAMNAYDENSYRNVGEQQLVGTRNVTGFVQIYDQMADLIDALHADGFDVWVVSASPQFVVEPVAALVGIDADRVLGIRTLVADGKLDGDLEGCGTHPDRANDIITFDEGKRCFINKHVFREPVATQEGTNANLLHRPVMVAGDSDTDIAMMKDASALKLVVNRNKVQLMCNAYSNAGDTWIVQPMFLAPKSCLATGYSCATAVDASGAPIVDENGDSMANQADAVCTLP